MDGLTPEVTTTDGAMGETEAASQEPDAKRARLAPDAPPLFQPGMLDGTLATIPSSTSGSTGELQIPQQFVGWLKGKGGGQIREIESRSGAHVSIDQSTKEQGYSRVLLAGTEEAVQSATEIISTELTRVMERDGVSGQSQAVALPGEETAEAFIPQKYVGWLKGSGGSQIRDMESRTGARIRIDQSTREAGYSVAQITGTPEAVQQCKAFVEAEVVRVQERDRVVMEHTSGPNANSSSFNEVQIPQRYVGWIKGSGGAQIKDIESRTGAAITMDQSTQELGFCRAMVYGSDEAVIAAKELIQNELARVQDRDRASGVGQTIAPPSRGGGLNNGSKDALAIVATLLAAAGQAAGSGGGGQQLMDALGMLANAVGGGAGAGAGAGGGCGGGGSGGGGYGGGGYGGSYSSGAPRDPADDGRWDVVRIPNTCVGWLKGRQGAMIRDIEGRSGSQVDIDQTHKDLGYSTAHMRGGYAQKKTAHGLVIAEVMKALDQSGDATDPSLPGTRTEFRVDTQYVGWVKGPRGKVVQDIQVKSATRIDVDQNTRDMGFATVKVFGTADGVRLARALIATELAKITPELAAQLVTDFPGGLEAAQQEARSAGHASACASAYPPVHSQPVLPNMDAQSVAGMFGQPDLSSLAALSNMGIAATPMLREQPQGELPVWRGPGDGQGTGFGQEDPYAREKEELREFLARHEEMTATADMMGQFGMQQGANPMMQPMFGVDGAAQQDVQPSMQQMEPLQQQPQQDGADGTSAAMQLMNSLQQLASAVSQATGQ